MFCIKSFKSNIFLAVRLRLQIDCEAIRGGPGPLGGSSESVAASQEPQLQAEVEATGGSVSGVSNQGNPSTQEVLNLAAHKYLKMINPSKPEDLNGLVLYLEKVRKVLIVDTKSGSLIITVECESLEILDTLWDDYCTGHLNEMAQEFLATKEILEELALTEVKLKTTILEEEYRTCRDYFLRYSGEFKSLHLNRLPFFTLFPVKSRGNQHIQFMLCGEQANRDA